jgi:peptide/nickel transport system substrate-binding protein
VAGIVLQPDPTEWNTMLQRIDERNFDAITLGWTGNIEGDPKQIFHSDSIKGGGSNYIAFRNKELDRLIDTARRTLDKDKRFELWHKVHQIIHEQQPYTFLFFSKSPVFMDKRIRNVQITNMGMNARTEMYVPAPLQLWDE